MKILTLNTHSWQEDAQLEKIQIVAQAIIEQGFDVIALQEVNQHQDASKIHVKTMHNEDIRQKHLRENNYGYLLQKKLSALGAEYQLTWDFVHQSYEVYEEGLAFLSRHPVLEHEVIDLNEDYDIRFWKHRRAVRIKVSIKGHEFDFFNCHCGWWNDIESPFQEHIDKIMAKVTSRPALLLGDFNNPAHILDQGHHYLLQKGLIDCYFLAKEKDEGTTVIKKIDGWKQNTNKLRIDFILSNHSLLVKTHKTIFNDHFYPLVSDHFGVCAQIKLDAL